MGYPPPRDAPPPNASSQDVVDAGFEPSPTGSQLCGFGLPTFGISVRIPGFQFPPAFWPPNLNFGIRLNCSLSEPFEAEFGFGGGRVPNFDPDQDDEYQLANPPDEW